MVLEYVVFVPWYVHVYHSSIVGTKFSKNWYVLPLVASWSTYTPYTTYHGTRVRTMVQVYLVHVPWWYSSTIVHVYHYINIIWYSSTMVLCMVLEYHWYSIAIVRARVRIEYHSGTYSSTYCNTRVLYIGMLNFY